MTLKEAKKRIEELETRLALLEKGVQIHINHFHHQVQPISPDPVKYDPFPVTCYSDRVENVGSAGAATAGDQCGVRAGKII